MSALRLIGFVCAPTRMSAHVAACRRESASDLGLTLCRHELPSESKLAALPGEGWGAKGTLHTADRHCMKPRCSDTATGFHSGLEQVEQVIQRIKAYKGGHHVDRDFAKCIAVTSCFKRLNLELAAAALLSGRKSAMVGRHLIHAAAIFSSERSPALPDGMPSPPACRITICSQSSWR